MKTYKLIVLALVLAIIPLIGVLLLLSNSGNLEGPFTLEQMLNAGLRVPLYSVDPSSTGYRTVYFTRDLSDFVQVTTYVVDDTQPSIAVALITTYTVFSGFEAGQEIVPVNWAAGEEAHVCEPTSGSSTLEVSSISLPNFRSCIYWIDSNGYFVRFQSVWPQDESVEFINSLLPGAAT
jgi:hypothetical protein